MTHPEDPAARTQKSIDPRGHKPVEQKKSGPWPKPLMIALGSLFLLLVGYVTYRALSGPGDEKPVAEEPVITTPVVVLKPVPTGCSVTDSTQTFCSSNTQVIRIIEAGDLLLLNPGTTHICSKKPIANITYKVVQNDKLRFTSSLDIENPRCDIFIVTRLPR